jgi:hypothetical protein
MSFLALVAESERSISAAYATGLLTIATCKILQHLFNDKIVAGRFFCTIFCADCKPFLNLILSHTDIFFHTK